MWAAQAWASCSLFLQLRLPGQLPDGTAQAVSFLCDRTRQCISGPHLWSGIVQGALPSMYGWGLCSFHLFTGDAQAP